MREEVESPMLRTSSHFSHIHIIHRSRALLWVPPYNCKRENPPEARLPTTMHLHQLLPSPSCAVCFYIMYACGITPPAGNQQHPGLHEHPYQQRNNYCTVQYMYINSDHNTHIDTGMGYRDMHAYESCNVDVTKSSCLSTCSNSSFTWRTHSSNSSS